MQISLFACTQSSQRVILAAAGWLPVEQRASITVIFLFYDNGRLSSTEMHLLILTKIRVPQMAADKKYA